MYARVARFEGGHPARFDEQIAEMRNQIEETRSGGLPADAPEAIRTLTETADGALNSMSPGEDVGRRTSVDIYEVAFDESFR